MEDVVVIDESGTHLGLIRLYGRAPRGERAYATTLRHYGKNISLVAAFGTAGMGASMTIEGAIDQAAFDAYIRHVLAPTLRPGQVILLDNLSVHKSLEVRRLIEACGCRVLFLPAYSPDLTPIEMAFSKVKALLRKAAALTVEALENAIAEALAAISPADAVAYFQSCGFRVPDQSA